MQAFLLKLLMVSGSNGGTCDSPLICAAAAAAATRRHRRAHQRLVLSGGAQHHRHRGRRRAGATAQHELPHLARRRFRARAVVGHLPVHLVSGAPWCPPSCRAAAVPGITRIMLHGASVGGLIEQPAKVHRAKAVTRRAGGIRVGSEAGRQQLLRIDMDSGAACEGVVTAAARPARETREFDVD